MTTTKNNEHKKLNFSSEREQSQACLNSAEHEKNQGRKVLNVPNLRFKEFEGEWEKCKLGDKCDLLCGYAFDGKDIVEQGTYLLMRGINITEGIIRHSAELDRYYTGSVNKLTKYKLTTGDLVIGMDGSKVGRNSAIVSPKENGSYLVQRVCRIKSCIGNDLILQLVNNHKFHKYVDMVKTSSAIPHISLKDIQNFPIAVPSVQNEADKISKLFHLLDERIATQNKIIDKLQSLIKGIGKQLFMDNQNWRTVKIGELLRIGNGKDYKRLGIGKIPVYGTGGQMLLVNDYLYDGESVCIGRKGTIDTPMFLNGKFWTVDTLFYTYDFKDVLPKFCYYLFLQINWKLYNEGTGVPSLSKSTIENIKVKIPSIEQQHNICSVLDCYEHKTKSEEQILELYLSEKQYLLRQMFI